MKMLITYNQKGIINSVAFLSENAENLELQPGRGEQVITVDSEELSEQVDNSNADDERLLEYQRRICKNLHVMGGKIVRCTK